MTATLLKRFMAQRRPQAAISAVWWHKTEHLHIIQLMVVFRVRRRSAQAYIKALQLTITFCCNLMSWWWQDLAIDMCAAGIAHLLMRIPAGGNIQTANRFRAHLVFWAHIKQVREWLAGYAIGDDLILQNMWYSRDDPSRWCYSWGIFFAPLILALLGGVTV